MGGVLGGLLGAMIWYMSRAGAHWPPAFQIAHFYSVIRYNIEVYKDEEHIRFYNLHVLLALTCEYMVGMVIYQRC